MAGNGKRKSNDWRRLNEIFEAAVELPTRDQILFLQRSCGTDASLRVEAESLLRAARKIGTNNFLDGDAFNVAARAIARETATFHEEGKRIGSYRIVSELAHGGMGVVYLAERDDFNQRVALKLIRSGLDSVEILRRFRTERDVLASLDHPNIARLVGGGTTDDGLPFLAMEYVEGVPVDRYCDSHELSIEEVLGLFRKVCSAVSYAHQNLTVHRDIKPSNILVTNEGEPKLLDFGISKILSNDSGSADTATADRLLTPEYASPEQLLGEKISTVSDVYSLGVLLYELLTGHRPFELKDRSAFEIVEAVCRTEPPAPSSWRDPELRTEPDTDENRSLTKPTRSRVSASQLRGDLDNIILTALRKDPERRYSSVEQFSEDIRRYLEGRPVLARPATLRYRAGKFIRRNRISVAFAALAVVALVGGAGVASWQAMVARAERDRAEQRFNDVRTLANTFVNDWHSGIREESISPEIRGRLADISSEYLVKLAADSDDPDVLRESAEAQIKLGHDYAYFMIDREKARRSFLAAEETSRRLLRSDPNDKSARSLLVLSLMKYTEFFGPEDLDGAISSRLEQIALRETDLVENPADVAQLRDLALAHEQLGDDLALRNDRSRALYHYHAADNFHARRIAILEDLPMTADGLTRLASTLSMRASNLSEHLAEEQQAIGLAYRAVEVSTAALASAPEDRNSRIAVVNANFDLGSFLRRSGDHAGAIVALRTSVEANRKFPMRDAYFTRREYDALLDMADSYRTLGNDSIAVALVRECFQIRRDWTARPENRESLRAFASHAFLFELGGRLLGRMGRTSEAEIAFDEAEAFINRVSDTEPESYANRVSLATLMISRGDARSGLNACQDPLLAPSPLDTACVSRSTARDQKSIDRAATHYRKAAETILSIPTQWRTQQAEHILRRAEERRAAASDS